MRPAPRVSPEASPAMIATLSEEAERAAVTSSLRL